MKPIPYSALELWLKHHLPESTPPEWKAYSLAQVVLAHFLGLDWVEANVMSNNSSLDFFRTCPTTEDDRIRHIVRVVQFGELLFNLQKVPGIERRIEIIRADPDRIEQTFTEFVALMILVLNGTPVRFVEPIGKKGEDFDFEILLPSRAKAYCEAKCKIEANELNIAGLEKSLKKARDQLPKYGPGVVFLSVPEHSLKDYVALSATVSIVIDKFFRDTTRVALVVVHGCDLFCDSHFSAGTLLLKEFKNEHSQYAAHFNRDFLRNITAERITKMWIRFIAPAWMKTLDVILDSLETDRGTQRP